MRRRHKIFYWVQDTGLSSNLWYTPKKGWSKIIKPGSSNVKTCYTIKLAMRHCRRINELGGKGHIGRFLFKRNNKLYDEFHVTGFTPWA